MSDSDLQRMHSNDVISGTFVTYTKDDDNHHEYNNQQVTYLTINDQPLIVETEDKKKLDYNERQKLRIKHYTQRKFLRQVELISASSHGSSADSNQQTGEVDVTSNETSNNNYNQFMDSTQQLSPDQLRTAAVTEVTDPLTDSTKPDNVEGNDDDTHHSLDEQLPTIAEVKKMKRSHVQRARQRRLAREQRALALLENSGGVVGNTMQINDSSSGNGGSQPLDSEDITSNVASSSNVSIQVNDLALEEQPFVLSPPLEREQQRELALLEKDSREGQTGDIITISTSNDNKGNIPLDSVDVTRIAASSSNISNLLTLDEQQPLFETKAKMKNPSNESRKNRRKRRHQLEMEQRALALKSGEVAGGDIVIFSASDGGNRPLDSVDMTSNAASSSSNISNLVTDLTLDERQPFDSILPFAASIIERQESHVQLSNDQSNEQTENDTTIETLDEEENDSILIIHTMGSGSAGRRSKKRRRVLKQAKAELQQQLRKMLDLVERIDTELAADDDSDESNNEASDDSDDGDGDQPKAKKSRHSPGIVISNSSSEASITSVARLSESQIQFIREQRKRAKEAQSTTDRSIK